MRPRVSLGPLQVDPVCLGTMTFGRQASKEVSFAILDEYVKLGGNFVDTAEAYVRLLGTVTRAR